MDGWSESEELTDDEYNLGAPIPAQMHAPAAVPAPLPASSWDSWEDDDIEENQLVDTMHKRNHHASRPSGNINMGMHRVAVSNNAMFSAYEKKKPVGRVTLRSFVYKRELRSFVSKRAPIIFASIMFCLVAFSMTQTVQMSRKAIEASHEDTGNHQTFTPPKVVVDEFEGLGKALPPISSRNKDNASGNAFATPDASTKEVLDPTSSAANRKQDNRNTFFTPDFKEEQMNDQSNTEKAAGGTPEHIVGDGDTTEDWYQRHHVAQSEDPLQEELTEEWGQMNQLAQSESLLQEESENQGAKMKRGHGDAFASPDGKAILDPISSAHLSDQEESGGVPGHIRMSGSDEDYGAREEWDEQHYSTQSEALLQDKLREEWNQMHHFARSESLLQEQLETRRANKKQDYGNAFDSPDVTKHGIQDPISESRLQVELENVRAHGILDPISSAHLGTRSNAQEEPGGALLGQTRSDVNYGMREDKQHHLTQSESLLREELGKMRVKESLLREELENLRTKKKQDDDPAFASPDVNTNKIMDPISSAHLHDQSNAQGAMGGVLGHFGNNDDDDDEMTEEQDQRVHYLKQVHSGSLLQEELENLGGKKKKQNDEPTFASPKVNTKGILDPISSAHLRDQSNAEERVRGGVLRHIGTDDEEDIGDEQDEQEHLFQSESLQQEEFINLRAKRRQDNRHNLDTPDVSNKEVLDPISSAAERKHDNRRTYNAKDVKNIIVEEDVDAYYGSDDGDNAKDVKNIIVEEDIDAYYGSDDGDKQDSTHIFAAPADLNKIVEEDVYVSDGSEDEDNKVGVALSGSKTTRVLRQGLPQQKEGQMRQRVEAETTAARKQLFSQTAKKKKSGLITIGQKPRLPGASSSTNHMAPNRAPSQAKESTTSLNTKERKPLPKNPSSQKKGNFITPKDTRHESKESTFNATALFAKFGIFVNASDEKSWPVLASSKQVRSLSTEERIVRYEAAMTKLQDVQNRSQVDPLSEESFVEPNATNRFPFKRKVDYLGVLVDAGRHYFPIPWLKRLIKYLYRLRYNVLHLRLTDDQAFNVKLTSYPELAAPSPSAPNNATYTPQELRKLVKFARKYKIRIIPEVNLPGHAGAWSGIANLTLACPEFACSHGYGIPLNIMHPQLRTILKGVLQEVIDIFDNPPFLHLGGDEVHMAEECFDEAGVTPFQYDEFEDQLEEILHEIDYPLEQVIRWEVTGPNASLAQKRAGKVHHNWHSLPGVKIPIDPDHTYFNSWQLYMDTNTDDGAEQIFRRTIQNFQFDKLGIDHTPTAILPATFELDTNQWMQRNVAARLIAVAMGAANLDLSESESIKRKYEELCSEMGLHPTVCDLQGFTAVPYWTYRRNWSKTWENWIANGTCARSGGGYSTGRRKHKMKLSAPTLKVKKIKVGDSEDLPTTTEVFNVHQ